MLLQEPLRNLRQGGRRLSGVSGSRRISTGCNLSRQALSFGPCRFRRPRGAVPADRLPALPACAAVFEHISNGGAALTPRAKARHGALAGVPNHLTGAELVHIALCNHAPFSLATEGWSSYQLATTATQNLAFLGEGWGKKLSKAPT